MVHRWYPIDKQWRSCRKNGISIIALPLPLPLEVSFFPIDPRSWRGLVRFVPPPGPHPLALAWNLAPTRSVVEACTHLRTVNKRYTMNLTAVQLDEIAMTKSTE